MDLLTELGFTNMPNSCSGTEHVLLTFSGITSSLPPFLRTT